MPNAITDAASSQASSPPSSQASSQPRRRLDRQPRTVFRTIAVLVSAIAMLSVAGCVSRDDTSSSVSDQSVAPSELAGLTLRVGDQKGGTESLLRAAGQLDNLPYKVEFSTFTSGPPQVEAATAGKIDFAVTGNTPPIFGAASSARIKVVSAYTNDASGDQILVPKNSAVTSVAALKGKKVAVGRGSSAHGHLLLQLRKAGLTPGSDVTLVFLQPADALSAFTNGSVDAWAIWDPYTAITQLQTGARTLVTAKGVANGYGFGIAADEALNDPKRNTALRDLVVRIAKASRWAGAHKQEWAEKYAAAIAIDPRAAATAQGRSLRPAILITDEVVKSEQDLTDIFVDTKQIQGAPKFADYVDRRFNDAVKPYVGAP